MAKCPKCNQFLKTVTVRLVSAQMDDRKIPSIIFGCPHCEVAISVQVNPSVLAEHLKQLDSM